MTMEKRNMNEGIRNVVRVALKARGMNVARLADALRGGGCKVKRHTVYYWFGNSGTIPITYVPSVCTALHIDPNTLFNWQG